MLSFKGPRAKDLCDPHLGETRRAFLRVGGASLFGLSLPTIMQLQSSQAQAAEATGKADAHHSGGPDRKSVV